MGHLAIFTVTKEFSDCKYGFKNFKIYIICPKEIKSKTYVRFKPQPTNCKAILQLIRKLLKSSVEIKTINDKSPVEKKSNTSYHHSKGPALRDLHPQTTTGIASAHSYFFLLNLSSFLFFSV